MLAVIPVLLYARHRFHGRPGVRFSSTGNASRAGRTLRRRLLFVPGLLRVMALVLVVVALARPQQGKERVRQVSRGVAIEMVVDRSGSMGAEMAYRGERLNRLEVVKRAFKEFVEGNGEDLAGRPSDLVGMVAFARYADTACPLTLAHGALSRFLENVRLVRRRSEDGTAIGDALALAAARLKTAEETLAEQTKTRSGQYEIKSKIIILLTDGENNCGRRAPLAAAELAKEWGIKIYAIGVGGGDAMTTIHTPLGDYKVPISAGVDMRTLKAVSERTSGISRLATDEESLREVYREIDRMEKSEIETVRFLDYRELFVPFALGGLCLLALETALSCTLFRRIP